MSNPPIVSVEPLSFPWQTVDPFLFCVYHDDAYPRSNGRMGPEASLGGRDLGQDFGRKDGWNMYHGTKVPGFPAHPHRGFETVTIVRKGLVDHSDSLGASARYGSGDVQWLTAGKGVVHSEMFPLLDPSAPNPLELFQIWLNLPARSKMAPARFTMFWSGEIPRTVATDTAGKTTSIAVVAGQLQELDSPSIAPLAPPPDSWASQSDADVAIWTLRMDAGARWTLPAAKSPSTRRRLYFFKGGQITVAGQLVAHPAMIELRGDTAIELVCGEQEGEFLLLQGKPIGEPVAQHGPFVMNTQSEILQAFADYRRDQFGGWPWPEPDPVHGSEPSHFAKVP